MVFAEQLRMLARRATWPLGDLDQRKSANVVRGLDAARELGMLTVGFTGRDGGTHARASADHCFIVPSFSIHRIQETHGRCFHVLWDLVHVARGEGRCHLSGAPPSSPSCPAAADGRYERVVLGHGSGGR